MFSLYIYRKKFSSQALESDRVKVRLINSDGSKSALGEFYLDFNKYNDWERYHVAIDLTSASTAEINKKWRMEILSKNRKFIEKTSIKY